MLASDIDPPSVQVARDNARLNGTGHLVQTIRATGFAAPQFAQRGPFDLVLANILANPLRQLATPMARHLAPSALVILSGLLTPSGGRRHRRLSRARAGAGAAPPDRRLEQPVAAHDQMTAAGRECGDCTLCCKVMAIEQLAKPASAWCPHCKPGRGCRIYADRPAECRAFSCLWLVNDRLGRSAGGRANPSWF